MNRIGWGFDAHRFGGQGSVLLAGVVVDETRALAATSDGDVVAHAIIDAVLGAAALGDIGQHFPSSDPAYHGADSMKLLATAVTLVREALFAVFAIDVTVVAERVRVGPHRRQIRLAIADALGVPLERVSVKATTTDGMGFIGADEGMAAIAVATLAPLV